MQPGAYYHLINGKRLGTHLYGKNPAGYHNSPAALPRNTWIYTTSVWDTNKITIYVDGKKVNEVAVTGTPRRVAS